MFVDALDVDDVIAHLLVTEGFSEVEGVAFVPIDDLLVIEGFDEDVAEELRVRAQNYLEQRDLGLNKKRVELGVSDDLASVEGVSPTMLVTLGQSGIKSRDDLADLAADELQELFEENPISGESANNIIIAARAHWFEEEENSQAADKDAFEEPDQTVDTDKT